MKKNFLSPVSSRAGQGSDEAELFVIIATLLYFPLSWAYQWCFPSPLPPSAPVKPAAAIVNQAPAPRNPVATLIRRVDEQEKRIRQLEKRTATLENALAPRNRTAPPLVPVRR